MSKHTPELPRAVACVQACRGIADPAELRTQRDELLAACKKALTCQSSMNSAVVEVIRAAIARAEEGGP